MTEEKQLSKAQLKAKAESEIDAIDAETRKDNAECAEHLSAAVRNALATLSEAGIVIGFATWAHERMRNALLSGADLLTRSGIGYGALYPGVKGWVTDNLGFIIGPIIAQSMPKDLHDNGIHISVTYMVDPDEWYWPDRRAEVDLAIRRENWFCPVWADVDMSKESIEKSGRTIGLWMDQIGDKPVTPGWYQWDMDIHAWVHVPQLSILRGVKFREHVNAIAFFAFGAGIVGIIEAVKVAAGKLG